MPQLQIDFYMSEFIWLFIFFTITYVILKYSFLPKILSIYKARDFLLKGLANNLNLLRNKGYFYRQNFYNYTVRAYNVGLIFDNKRN